MLTILLMAMFQPCTYSDVHGHTQPCAVQQQCVQGKEHLHPTADKYIVQKDAWSQPVQVPGDNMCHDDSTDKPLHPPTQVPGGK